MNIEQLTDQLFEAISLVIMAKANDEGESIYADDDGEEYTVEKVSGGPEDQAKAALREILESLTNQKKD